MARSRKHKGSIPPQQGRGTGELGPRRSASAQFARDEERASRRTNNIVLIGIGAVIAMPLLLRGESMQRNVYRDYNDCVADYSEAQCERTYTSSSGTSYLGGRGPWYESEGRVTKENPGPGRSRTSAFAASGSVQARALVSVEYGVRGGFGHTGSVRSVGS